MPNMKNVNATFRKGAGLHPVAIGVAATTAALIAAAIINHRLRATAERQNPATGKFLDIDGVRLHYVEKGSGEPLILLHGNGSMIQDFETSGLMSLAARKFRTIAFDRPGFGHSSVRAVLCGRRRRRRN